MCCVCGKPEWEPPFCMLWEPGMCECRIVGVTPRLAWRKYSKYVSTHGLPRDSPYEYGDPAEHVRASGSEDVAALRRAALKAMMRLAAASALRSSLNCSSSWGVQCALFNCNV